MIHWEARSSNVVCTSCFSSDTRMLFEFLAFTRHVCRACGQTFVTVAQPESFHWRESSFGDLIPLLGDGLLTIDASALPWTGRQTGVCCQLAPVRKITEQTLQPEHRRKAQIVHEEPQQPEIENLGSHGEHRV
jgi:hypothetical protein